MSAENHTRSESTERSKSSDSYSSDDTERREEERASITERLFTIFSIILLASGSIYLVYQSFAPSTPPSFAVEISYQLQRGKYRDVNVYITNSSTEAAKAIHISGELTGQDGKPLESEATLDWLPGNSRRKLTLVFPAEEVTTGIPKIYIKGYEQP